MALAKYYEEILERLISNTSSINYLARNENRWLISDERWQQIFVNLKNQTEKAEKICNQLSNKNLLELQNEIDILKLENAELKSLVDRLGNGNNKENILHKNLSIHQAIIYRHDIQNGKTLVALECYKDELVVNHKDFPDIIDSMEGAVLDVVVDIMGNILVVNKSERSVIDGYAQFTTGKLKMAKDANYAIIKSNGVTAYVPEWICENFYQRGKTYNVYYLAVEKCIMSAIGKVYNKVALQVFVLDN